MAWEWLGLVKEFPAFKPRALLGYSLIGATFLYLLEPSSPWHPIPPDWALYRPHAVMVTVASGVFWALSALEWAAGALLSRGIQRRRYRRLIRNLANLSPPEAVILGFCFASGTTSITLPLASQTANTLTAKGFLRLVPGFVGYAGASWIIPDEAWAVLTSPVHQATLQAKLVAHYGDDVLAALPSLLQRNEQQW